MLELSSVFLALLTNRLPVVLGSVRVRSPRSTSKRLKGGTYVHKSIYYLQRPAVPHTFRTPCLAPPAPHTRRHRYPSHASPSTRTAEHPPTLHLPQQSLFQL